MSERPLYKHEEVDFPAWVPTVFGSIALVAVTVAVVQRQSAGQPMTRPIVAAALILIPFLLEIAQMFFTKRIVLPRYVFPIPVLVGTGLLVFHPTQVDFAPFVLVFVTALMAGSADRWFGGIVGVASAALMVAADIVGVFSESFVWVIGIAFGWFGGFLVGSLSLRTLELKLANQELAEKSAAEERQRIARDVHDVIAHSMSVTMLHVTAARMALERAEDRRGEAIEALREAEQQGRKSLTEIRRTVGLLGPDETGVSAPMPTAADVPRLVDEFRDVGVNVKLSVSGDLSGLPPAAGLNLYRIVQESLTNVAKHAPRANASVDLGVTDDEIRLRVHNTTVNGAPSNRGGGLGLKGMAERAALLNGTLHTDASDGWTVDVVAPRPTT